MPIDRFPDARDDELARLAGELRSDLARRRIRAMATGIVMVLDDVDAGDADLRITACAVRHHLDVDTLAATICRTLRYP